MPESSITLLHGEEGGSLRSAAGLKTLRQVASSLAPHGEQRLQGHASSEARCHPQHACHPTFHSCLPACRGPYSWIPTPGHSPGHVAYLHQPSGTLIAGDALFNVLPSLSWASGIEAIVTRPLGWVAGPVARWGLAPVRAALGPVWGLLADFAGGLPGGKMGDTLGMLSAEQLTSSAVSGSADAAAAAAG